MKWLLFSFHLVLVGPSFLLAFELGGYASEPSIPMPEPIALSAETGGWTLGDAARWSAEAGKPPELVLDQRSPQSASLGASIFLRVQPRTSYEFVCEVAQSSMATTIPGRAPRLRILVEWSDNETFSPRVGATLVNAYYKNSAGWRRFSGTFRVPETPGLKYRLSVSLGIGETGVVRIRGVTLGPTPPAWTVYPVDPPGSTLSPQGGRLEFASLVENRHYLPGNGAGALSLLVRLKPWAGRVLDVMVPETSSRAAITYPPLPPGACEVETYLLDVGRKKVVGTGNFSFQVRDLEPTTVGFDSYGGLSVAGKPFLPVGIYAGGIGKRELDALGDSPFNAVMAYGSLSFRTSVDKAISVESLNHFITELDGRGLKTVFSLKDVGSSVQAWNGNLGADSIIRAVVEGVRHNPGLLSWYLADEPTPGQADVLSRRKEAINALDSDHPVWVVHNQIQDLPRFGASQDVWGLDYYPIQDEGSRTIGGISRQMDQLAPAAASSNGSFRYWAVSQIFNQGSYAARNDPEKYRRYKDPTEMEMLAMPVLNAIYGAKGFFFYSLQDLFRGPDKGQFDRRWPAIKRVAQSLRDLEGFLLSPRPEPDIAVSAESGTVLARAWKNSEGKTCVLVAAVGPGPAVARLKVEGMPKLRSLTGLTRTDGTVYRFEGTDIACDILTED